ncbi:MAG: hypothetical protein HY870_22940 [Chloroflexi bacterium]|nr:hypothetical protein [Chloroflexota bacterium]
MKLIALRCPSCNNALAPNDDDLVIACGNCGAAIAITDEGLQPIELRFSVSGTAAAQYQPWWVFEGRVQINRREAQSGNRREEALAFWAQPRSFFVPAWELSLQALKRDGLEMLQKQPQLQAGPRPAQVRLSPVVVSAEDARRMLEFLVLSLEAGRADWLKTIDFKVEVSEPVLWALGGT